MLEFASTNDAIWLICGDLGYSVLEPFAERFPSRFVNAGVAEQNMASVAAGVASCGGIAVTYSFVNFALLRCLEQIRNDICHNDLNVKIVALGAGLVYGAAGSSHHGVEDLAIARTLPGLSVLSPADPVETRLATGAMLERRGPCYLRLGRAGEGIVHQSVPELKEGLCIPLMFGRDALIIATGGLVLEALSAARELADREISVAVWSAPWISPLGFEMIADAWGKYPLIVTAEEGISIGGLGGAVAELGSGLKVPNPPVLIRLGVREQIARTSFSREEGLRDAGLDAQGLISTVMRGLSGPAR